MNNASSIVRRYYDHHPHYYCTPLPLCSTAQLCTTAIAQHLRYYDIFAISRNMPHLLQMISTEFCYQIRNDLSNIPKSCAPSLETYCCHIHQKEVYTNMGQIACSDSQTLTSQQSSPIEKHSFTLRCFSVKWLHQFRMRRGQGRFGHQNQHVLFQSSFSWRFRGAPHQSSGYAWKE